MAQPPWPKGHKNQWRELVAAARRMDGFDHKLEPEIQTDKELVKVLPCQFCQRPLIVTTFYVLAWAKCSPCKGEGDGMREPGSVDVVQAGRTEPRLAKDLTKVLINPEFANALCPVRPNDPDHQMELKHVHHNDNYGPHEWKIVDGKMTRVMVAPGETALLQCLKCYAVVTYSTTAVTQFNRINEPGAGKNVNTIWGSILGSREEEPVEADG